MENEEKGRILGFAHPSGEYLSKENLEMAKEKSRMWKNIYAVIAGDKLYLVFDGKVFEVALREVENEDGELESLKESNEVKDIALAKRIMTQIEEIRSHWFGREPKTDAEKKEFEKDLARLETLERLLYEKK